MTSSHGHTRPVAPQPARKAAIRQRRGDGGRTGPAAGLGKLAAGASGAPAVRQLRALQRRANIAAWQSGRQAVQPRKHFSIPGVLSQKVVQRNGTELAIFGQSHNDKGFIDAVFAQIKKLQADGVRFAVCVEEAPGVSAAGLVKTYRGRLQEMGKPKSLDGQAAKAQLEAELPVFEFLAKHDIPVHGVDAAAEGSNIGELLEWVEKNEMKRIEAMTGGFIQVGRQMTKQGGGVVLGFSFGAAHVTGLVENLKLQGAGDEFGISGVSSHGDYYSENKAISAWGRTVRSQMAKLDEKSELHGLLSSAEDNFAPPKEITVTYSANYAKDVEAVVSAARERMAKAKPRQGPPPRLVMERVDTGTRASSLSDETAPLLDKGRRGWSIWDCFCCCSWK